MVSQTEPVGNTPGEGDGAGLVHAIISARLGHDVVAVMRPCGLGVKVRSVGPDSTSRDVSWTRGTVRGFSAASRRRMMGKLASIEWDAMPCYFVTLTYHLEWGRWKDWKRQLRTFRKRLERTYPTFAAAVWKLEAQRRGAPHFHVAAFFVREVHLPTFRAWVSSTWNTIIGGSAAHLRAGTQVKPTRNTSGPGVTKLMGYLGKYLAKRQGSFVDPHTGEVLETGRIWGLWNQDAMPWGELVAFDLCWQDYLTLTRRLRRWGQQSRYLSKLTGQWRGFLVLGDSGQLWQLLRGLDTQRVEHQRQPDPC